MIAYEVFSNIHTCVMYRHCCACAAAAAAAVVVHCGDVWNKVHRCINWQSPTKHILYRNINMNGQCWFWCPNQILLFSLLQKKEMKKIYIAYREFTVIERWMQYSSKRWMQYSSKRLWIMKQIVLIHIKPSIMIYNILYSLKIGQFLCNEFKRMKSLDMVLLLSPEGWHMKQVPDM